MSFFAGLVHTSSRPAQAEDLSFLFSTLGHTNSLGTLATGSCVFRTCDEVSATADTILVGRIRIDNRDELTNRLGLAPNDSRDLADAQLVVMAWQRWGAECCIHLIGDFAFALWDKKSRSLLLARDAFGPSELYFHVNSDRMLFANSLGFILKDPEIFPQPNLAGLALSTLLVASADGTQTLYDGIRQIPSAHYLLATPGTVQLRQYWSTDNIKPVTLASPSAYQQALIQQLGEAVACRLQPQPVGILLSGGLDSCSIASLAADHLKRANHVLTPYTSVPAYAPVEVSNERFCTNELGAAERVTQYCRTGQIRIIDAKHVSPMAGLRRIVDILLHPLFAVTNAHWLVAAYEAMQSDGMKVVLSGQNGNATISWHGSDIKLMQQLITSGHWLQAAKALTALKATYGWGIASALRRLIVAPLVPSTVLAWRRRFLDRNSNWMADNPLNKSFMDDVRLKERFLDGGGYSFSPSSPDLRRFMLPIGLSSGGGIGAALAGHFGLQLRDPSSDRRLIEFCLGVPENQFVRNGNHRVLLKQAMRGLLPDETIDNKRYGLQSADLLTRLRATAGEVESELCKAENSALSEHCLDLPKLRQSFERLKQDDSFINLLRTSRILLRGLALSMFLQRFEKGN